MPSKNTPTRSFPLRESRYALAKATGIGFPIIDRYYKNQVVRYDSDVLSRIITALDCEISDILTIENRK